MRRLIAPLALVAIVVVALVATVGDGGATGDPDAVGPALPQLSVPRLDGGGEFDLARLASSQSPTLLWFWAPWCEICNQEAANIERLAVEGRTDLAVVAIGGRDDAVNGPAFVARHGLRAPTILFDESMAAWEAYRIPGQPGAVLLDRDGRERARWSGPFDTNVLTVEDEGAGVPSALEHAIFDRHVSTAGSTGLGLSLARALVEADGGRLILTRPRPARFEIVVPGRRDEVVSGSPA